MHVTGEKVNIVCKRMYGVSWVLRDGRSLGKQHAETIFDGTLRRYGWQLCES